MTRLLQQLPVDLAIMAPFPDLADLAAHEQKLLAGMRPHETEVGTQICELLPIIAGCLPVERAFAVHHLIMAERQDEALRECVHQSERHLVVVPSAVDRLMVEVVERVVHPSHVPLVREAETTFGNRRRYAG